MFSAVLYQSLVAMFKIKLGLFSPSFLGTFLNVTSLFITSCITCFLLLGCLSPAPTFSSVYFIEYSFNESSSFYDVVQHGYSNASNSETSSNLANMKIRAGYLGLCGLTANSSNMTCVGRTSYGLLEDTFHDLSVYLDDVDEAPIVSFDPVQLASLFSNHIATPGVVITTLVVAVFAFFISIARLVCRFSPRASLMLRKANLGISIAGTIVGFINAVWIEVAIRSSTYLIGQSSGFVLQAGKGVRAEAMVWTSWVFFVLSLSIISLETLREFRLAKAAVIEKNEI